MDTTKKTSKKRLYAAVAGTVLAALCCATPILVLTLGAIGLGVFTPYLYYVLMPALIILIMVVWVSYDRYKKACSKCEMITDKFNNLH
ncbi:MAG: mercury resistance system transport protein MerF [Bacteroidota bacterium]|nr:mercury resistance system transport protein MerF [Bacteroidota bacterium]